MPENSRVHRCVEKLKAKGDSKYNPYAVCQASTKQSYKTGKPLKKKKRKKKMKSKTEALEKFITSLKTEKNKAFVEGIVMKGFKVCFEQEFGEEEEDTMEIPDTAEEMEETKTKLDEVAAANQVKEMKEEELKEITTDE